MMDLPVPPTSSASAYTEAVADGVLALVQRRLNSAATVGELLARACDEALLFCGFSRAIVLGVEEGRLTTTVVDPIEDPGSDALRRQVLAAPIPIATGSEEAELLRIAAGRREGRPSGPSVVADHLGLQEYVIAAVAPEARAVALIVLDRARTPVGESDRAVVDLFAHLLGLTVERVVLRRRMHELAGELRHLTASANALMTEALESPVGLMADFGHGPIFTTAGQFSGTNDELNALLSDRERAVAALMVGGRSNREIGDELHLSSDTVKAHVARLVRKLGASNRVEAVARYVTLSRGSGS